MQFGADPKPCITEPGAYNARAFTQ